MKTDTALNVVLGVFAVCAVTTTALAVRREFFEPRGVYAQQAPGHISHVKNWREYAGVGHRLGSQNAKVTITEFGDFECPACAAFAINLEPLRARYGDTIAIVYRHFPLELVHPYAMAAANAAECAGTLGEFGTFYDTVFHRQSELGQWSWSMFAKRAGIRDTVAFSRCVSDTSGMESVRRDIAAGKRLGVDATPTVLVNDLLLPDPPSPSQLDSLIRTQLKAAHED